MCIYSILHIRYHIGCMYDLICICGLTHIRHCIFHIHMISHILAISHVLKDLRNSGLPIFRVTWPHTDPMPYIFLYTEFTNYTDYTTYTAFSLYKLSTVPGVTPKIFILTCAWYSSVPRCWCWLIHKTIPHHRLLRYLFGWSVWFHYFL